MSHQLHKAGCVFCLRALQQEYDAIKFSTFAPSIISFIPLNPVTEGHRLFLPSIHIEHSISSERIVAATFQAAYEYAQTMQNRSVTDENDFNLIISSGDSATQTIPHLHVHYVPRRPNDKLRLPWTGQKK